MADSPRLLRLDLRENEVKTAGLMALSLALKVNQTVTRVDLDRETKKESVSGVGWACNPVHNQCDSILIIDDQCLC